MLSVTRLYGKELVTYYQPQPGQYPQQYGYGYAQPMKQSGFGIASLLIALIATVGLIASVTAAAIGVSRNPSINSGELPFNDPNWIQNDPDGTLVMVAIAGCSMLIMLLLALLGVVLGLVGAFSATRKKGVAIVGLSLNSLLLVGMLLLFVIGAVAG